MSAQFEPRLCTETAAPANIVIFGATGDLTKRKLMPALVRMLDCGLVHPDSRIIGVVRDMADKRPCTSLDPDDVPCGSQHEHNVITHTHVHCLSGNDRSISTRTHVH